MASPDDASPPARVEAAPPGPSRVALEVAERGDQLVPCPIVSRGRPRFSGAEAGRAWVALQAGVGPAALLVRWSLSEGAGGADAAAVPAGYLIETSASSTDGRDGEWRREASIEGNTARARSHVIEFDGQSWVRLSFEATSADAMTLVRLDLHDASDGTDDCWLLLGAPALAAGAAVPGAPTWAELIHERYPGYFPAVIEEGSIDASIEASIQAGLTGARTDDTSPSDGSAAHALERARRLFAVHPAARRVAIAPRAAWKSSRAPARATSARAGAGAGSEEETALGTETGADAAAALDALVAAVLDSGRLPVLAREPAVAGRSRAAVDAYNRCVSALEARHALVPGPDFAAWFEAHPDQLDHDGRPSEDGCSAIRQLWADALDVFYVPQ